MDRTAALAALLNSFAADFVARRLVVGLTVGWSVLEALPLPDLSASVGTALARQAIALNCANEAMASYWVSSKSPDRALSWRRQWAVSDSERLRRRCIADALCFSAYDLGRSEVAYMLGECDLSFASIGAANMPRKGFWRVDKEKEPELRHTVLTLVAFADLQAKIEAIGGDRDKGIDSFLSQNDGEGWMLPETLRLADYGLGHDDRAQHPQPVASRLGPRFFDWQLAQTAEESWRECEVHARSLEGAPAELPRSQSDSSTAVPVASQPTKQRLF